MFKRYIWLAVATVFFVCHLCVGNAVAAELDEATRTVKLNPQGSQVTMSVKQLTQGKRLFNYACAICHLGGGTKTNPNVGLDPASLKGALPQRDNVEALVDYMHNPTTYDGLQEIAELHPSTKSADVFPKMRNLTEDDLVAIAGHILVQPKVKGEMWGGGKAYN
jgi:photosystem II cytochrome c550